MISLVAALVLRGAPQTFAIQNGKFQLNGQPFLIHSGEMHYPRVPRAYWRDRFKMARAMGLNTICTYVFWNEHEQTPGKFDFTGNRDLATFIKTAQQEGLYVIVRPGPYICSELDFGGYPAWLLKDKSLVVRSRDAKYLKYVERYLQALSKQVRPLLLKNGGPVIMTQVENEYGSYGSDHAYMAWMRDALKRNGFDTVLYTSDGSGKDQLDGGTLPDLSPTVNFGGGAEGEIGRLRAYRPDAPPMIGEYWAGWFDHWGKPHHRTSVEGHVKDLKWCLDNDVSFNLYMFHGGTNFGFMQGSNGGRADYNVDVTSYDYDSPLDESGRVTDKYRAFRTLLASYAKNPLPPVPVTPSTIKIAPIALQASDRLFAKLPKPVTSSRPLTMEVLDQSYGMVLYRTTLKSSGKQKLEIPGLGDYATVFVNGRRLGTLERRLNKRTLDLDVPGRGATLDILVEGLSRVNFGYRTPTERKGIDGDVLLDGRVATGWEHYSLPLAGVPKTLRTSTGGYGPRYYRSTFRVTTPGDTFLDMRGWNKGFVWVNGHNLGRYWSIGPQQTLYMPGTWLRAGSNEIVVLDDGAGVAKPVIAGLAAPVLDEIAVDPSLVHKKKGQTISFAGQEPFQTVELPNARTEAIVKFPKPETLRYLAIVAKDDQRGTNFTSLAEINALGTDGRSVDRSAWKVIYADSEETSAENGSSANLIDNQPTTFWHSEWSESTSAHPHVVILDLGATTTIEGLRLLPRQDGGTNGRLKNVSFFGSLQPFKGL